MFGSFVFAFASAASDGRFVLFRVFAFRDILGMPKQKKGKGSRGAADVTRIDWEGGLRLPTRRGTHHPRGDERGERDGLLRRRASLRVEIAGRDRGQSMRGDTRAIRRARKDRTDGDRI
jgi:hypothetical protein